MFADWSKPYHVPVHKTSSSLHALARRRPVATIITYLLRPRIYINIYTREKINTPIPLHTAFAGLIAGPRNGGKKFWYVIDITNK